MSLEYQNGHMGEECPFLQMSRLKPQKEQPPIQCFSVTWSVRSMPSDLSLHAEKLKNIQDDLTPVRMTIIKHRSNNKYF
jgi:hypothetical protein